ncbi:hypothetical protein E3N88_35177 [Mikania micrantha]|uniref:Uncharacterized protein n=1 Tax=Mikania micrantha TaxID=192012 RepID=A0A5N6M090_9ASTR|nr:hypothetical protein E3N88_35177 [Mikania micrantha]
MTDQLLPWRYTACLRGAPDSFVLGGTPRDPERTLGGLKLGKVEGTLGGAHLHHHPLGPAVEPPSVTCRACHHIYKLNSAFLNLRKVTTMHRTMTAPKDAEHKMLLILPRHTQRLDAVSGNLGGVTDWYQSLGYRELGVANNLERNLGMRPVEVMSEEDVKKMRRMVPLADIIVPNEIINLREVMAWLEMSEVRVGLVEAHVAALEAMVEAIAAQVAVELEEEPFEYEEEEPFEDE